MDVAHRARHCADGEFRGCRAWADRPVGHASSVQHITRSPAPSLADLPLRLTAWRRPAIAATACSARVGGGRFPRAGDRHRDGCFRQRRGFRHSRPDFGPPSYRSCLPRPEPSSLAHAAERITGLSHSTIGPCPWRRSRWVFRSAFRQVEQRLRRVGWGIRGGACHLVLAFWAHTGSRPRASTSGPWSPTALPRRSERQIHYAMFSSGSCRNPASGRCWRGPRRRDRKPDPGRFPAGEACGGPEGHCARPTVCGAAWTMGLGAGVPWPRACSVGNRARVGLVASVDYGGNTIRPPRVIWIAAWIGLQQLDHRASKPA